MLAIIPGFVTCPDGSPEAAQSSQDIVNTLQNEDRQTRASLFDVIIRIDNMTAQLDKTDALEATLYDLVKGEDKLLIQPSLTRAVHRTTTPSTPANPTMNMTAHVYDHL